MLLLALTALLAAPAAAQMPRYSMERVARPAKPDAIPLYPAALTPAGAAPESWEQTTAVFPDGQRKVDRMVRNVSVPSITPFLPDPAKATGAAVIVAPGGAFMAAIKGGGAESGIGEPRAYQDALEALKVVRARAGAWRVDPAQVGMIGLSAGAMTTLQSVLTAQGAAQPAFIGYIYGPMMDEFHLWLASRGPLGTRK